MALHFVSTSILSSDDGIAYSKEEQLESEDAKKSRLQSEKSSNKTLFEQLNENQIKKQEEFDLNTKLMFAPPKALDEEDIEFLNSVRNQKQIRNEMKHDEETKLLREFRSSQRGSTIPTLNQNPVIAFQDKQSIQNESIANVPFIVKKRKLNKENSDNVVNVTTVEKNDENSQTFLSLFNDYGSNSDEDS